MIKYTIKRLLTGLATLFVLATATFFLMKLIPGSPFGAEVSQLPPQTVEKLFAKYNLDKSIPEQYLIYMKNVLHGDFGESLMRKGTDVTYIIGKAFPVTMKVGLSAFCFSMIVGITLGIVAALTKHKWVSNSVMVLAKSKGTAPFWVIVKHGLKNCLIPVITYAGPLIANLVTGSFVIESLFSIPGLGGEFVTSVTNRDYTLIMALTIFFGALIIVVNIITDLVSALVDPRIKLDKKGKSAS